ncbi:MAG: hypothetical protein FWG65_13330 [Turicibacter sp.]|nr:hypothetical protein [Turicibacter sp.]
MNKNKRILHKFADIETPNRLEFEVYKGNICHFLKEIGDIDFMLLILQSNEIIRLWQAKWYAESLYLLGMLDYLSRVNDIPICTNFDSLRTAKFQQPIYPIGVITECIAFGTDEPKKESVSKAIPEFLRFNIVECEVRDVC